MTDFSGQVSKSDEFLDRLDLELKSLNEREDTIETWIASSILDCFFDVISSLGDDPDQLMGMVGELCKAVIGCSEICDKSLSQMEAIDASFVSGPEQRLEDLKVRIQKTNNMIAG